MSETENTIHQTCANCEHTFLQTEGFLVEFLVRSWSEKKAEFWFCSEECEEAYELEYFECDHCHRAISEYETSGIALNYHILNGGVQICRKCYQDEMIKYGQPADEFDSPDSIRGGDFMDEDELKQNGFVEEGTYSIRGAETAGRYNTKARNLIDEGYLVITQYGLLSITGGQGTVTLWKKMQEPDLVEEPEGRSIEAREIHKCLTTYTRSNGAKHKALLLPWWLMKEALGHEFRGYEDENAITSAIMQAGGPEWVEDCDDGWSDEFGWGLIGPEIPEND